MVIVVKNCEELIKNDNKNFGNLLDLLIKETENLRIVILSDPSVDLYVAKKYHKSIIEIELLEKKYAAELLKALDVDNKLLKNWSVCDLAKHNIFEYHYNKVDDVFETYQLLKEHKYLNKIVEHFEH